MRPAKTLKQAKALRANMTDAERKLWFLPRDRRFEGYKFRRQHPVAPYILDFACPAEKLVIEVDGGQHCENPYDERRTEWLQAKGWRVIRFWNNEVLGQTEGVMEMILRCLEGPSPLPSPPSEERE